MKHSLGTRLALAAGLPSALVFGLAFWGASEFVQREVESSLGRELVATARAGAAALPVDRLLLLAPGDDETRTARNLRERLATLARATGAVRPRVADLQRRLLVDAEGTTPIGTPLPELERDRFELEQVAAGRALASTVVFEDRAGNTFQTGYAPLTDEAGKVVAVLALDGSATHFRTLRQLRAALLALGLVGAGLLGLFSFLLGRLFVAPISQLVEAARRIGAGRLTQSVPVAGEDELGELASELDAMRSQLQARDTRLQMMLAGIAHEVRNPLGGMELYAGLLADDLRQQPAEAELVAKIRRELDALRRLVDEFLDFAREREPLREPHDLAQLAREALELSEAFAQPRGVLLKGEGLEGTAPLQADGVALRRVLLNLLKNGCEASATGQTVTLKLERLPGRLRLSVSDAGPGVAPEVAPKLFEPFFTTREKGTGLGLAFARKVAAAHGGTVQLAPTGPGATFLLELPER